MEENKRLLDLTCLNLSDREFASMKDGLEQMTTNTNIARYFGYVDKRGMKYLCKAFGYVDKAAMWRGAVSAWLGIAGGMVVIKLLEKRRKKPNDKIFVMSVAKDEESE